MECVTERKELFARIDIESSNRKRIIGELTAKIEHFKDSELQWKTQCEVQNQRLHKLAEDKVKLAHELEVLRLNLLQKTDWSLVEETLKK